MLKQELALAVEVLKLNPITMKVVADKRRATTFGLFFWGAPVLINLFLGAIVFPSGFGAIFSRFLSWSILIPPLSFCGSLFLMTLVGKKYFSVPLVFEKLFRVGSYAALCTSVTVVPFLLASIGLIDYQQLFGLTWLISLFWLFSAVFHYLVSDTAVNRQNVISLLMVGVLAYFIINAVLGEFMVGSVYRLF